MDMQCTIIYFVQQTAVPVFNVSVMVTAKCLEVQVKKSTNIESKIIPKYPKQKCQIQIRKPTNFVSSTKIFQQFMTANLGKVSEHHQYKLMSCQHRSTDWASDNSPSAVVSPQWWKIQTCNVPSIFLSKSCRLNTKMSWTDSEIQLPSS